MFNGDKFRTIGIEENISLEMQLFMWSAVENMPESKDCFQVFELKFENGLQVIHHYSEQPVFDMTYIIPTIAKPVNAKVYVIDDYYSDNDKHIATMLLAEDIENLQEIVRQLRHSGARANETCGIHIHIGSENHTAKTLANLVNIMTSKQSLIYKALDIKSEREHYCKKLESGLSEKIRKIKPDSLEKMADIWYDGYYGDRHAHYNESRYHCLNLHSVFTKGTVEFRLFNSTTHAGKIKAYIQFCLAVNHQALTQKSASSRVTEITNPKYTFRTWLLRLGLIGNEFKTARLHLLANLDGNTAWRNA